MTRGFFNEYSWGFTRDRRGVKTADPERLPLCQHAEEYLSWVADRYPKLVEHPTPKLLDEAILAITKEFGFRRRFITPERFNTCLQDVYLELLSGMIDKQLELYRHWRPPAPPTPTLFVGEDEEEEEDE